MQSTRRTHLATLLLLPALLALPACGPSADDDYAARMAEEHAGDTPEASGAAGETPRAELEEADVVYATLDGAEVTGFLVEPADARPGGSAIVVIQEWWGLNDNIRDMARRLAGEGYTALAVDLYEGAVATTPEEARNLMTAAMERPERLEQNLEQAVRYLIDELDAGRIGTIGWCFGGGWSLAAALELPEEVDAAVMYYGRVVDDRERLEALDAPLLGIFGEDDGGIPVDGVRAFEALLAELGKEAEIHVYPGVGHAFANPSGTRYDADAAEDAWGRTLAFFAEHLRN